MDKLCKAEIREALLDGWVPPKKMVETLERIGDAVHQERLRRLRFTRERREIEMKLRGALVR